MRDPLPTSDPFRGVTVAEVRASVEFEAAMARRSSDQAAAKEVKAKANTRRKAAKAR